MASNEVSICNLALAHLGQNQIMALTDENQSARFCSVYYPQTRDEVLASHPWTFAILRANLTEVATEPVSEWQHQYQLPNDCIRVIRANDFGWWEAKGAWQVEGRVLLSNETEATIRYVARITDASTFTPLFVEAVSVKLAARLAKPLAGDAGMMQSLLSEYERITGPKARRTDAFESSPPIVPAYIDSQLVQSRTWGAPNPMYRWPF